MTWSETHRRLAALRAVEAELDRTGDGQLPWRPEYADIFGDRHTLLLQLRYRWRLLVQAQVEPTFEGAAASRALAGQHPGLLAALRRNSWELTEIAEQDRPERMGAAG